MKREQGKKASQKKARLNLTPFVWGGGARSSKVKRVAEANSPEAARQIYAKRQGKFKAKS
ncbi:hypothetical protein HRN94_000084 [Campylobacter upsaliensis]|nr:hypothetical protein [Campylobacter upsaliensis]